MNELVYGKFSNCDIFVMSAAVGDFESKQIEKEKLPLKIKSFFVSFVCSAKQHSYVSEFVASGGLHAMDKNVAAHAGQLGATKNVRRGKN